MSQVQTRPVKRFTATRNMPNVTQALEGDTPLAEHDPTRLRLRRGYC
jgi:hypothetical protein